MRSKQHTSGKGHTCANKLADVCYRTLHTFAKYQSVIGQLADVCLLFSRRVSRAIRLGHVNKVTNGFPYAVECGLRLI